MNGGFRIRQQTRSDASDVRDVRFDDEGRLAEEWAISSPWLDAVSETWDRVIHVAVADAD